MYFASIRELTGIAEEAVEVPEASTVGTLMKAVKGLHEPLRGVERMLVAVNGKFTGPGVALGEGDVAALFPPVSGG